MPGYDREALERADRVASLTLAPLVSCDRAYCCLACRRAGRRDPNDRRRRLEMLALTKEAAAAVETIVTQPEAPPTR